MESNLYFSTKQTRILSRVAGFTSGGLLFFSALTPACSRYEMPSLRKAVRKQVQSSFSRNSSWKKPTMHSPQNHSPKDWLLPSPNIHSSNTYGAQLPKQRQNTSIIFLPCFYSCAQPDALWRQRLSRGCSSGGKVVCWKSGSATQAQGESKMSGQSSMARQGSLRAATNYFARARASAYASRDCSEGEREREGVF